MRNILGLGVLLVAASCSNNPQPDSGNEPPDDTGVSTDLGIVDVQRPTDIGVQADVPAVDAGPRVDTCRGPAMPAWFADPRMCLVTYATGVSRPRGMAFAPNGDLFVTVPGSVTVLFDTDGDGVASAMERTTFVSVAGLNHGIVFSPDGAFLYVSSPSDVYRLPYVRGQRMATAAPQRMISGIPAGGHSVRGLVFGADGRLYVSVGSAGNLDQSTTDLTQRSLMRRFTVPATIAAPVDFATGEIIATGMRNESGLALDSAGRLWGVENGRDNAVNAAGVDIHFDNPAEELNLIDTSARHFYGYPSCFSEGLLPGGAGPGTQHGDSQSTSPMVRDDAWCRNPANVRRPAFGMPAHWAPLGLTEYTGTLLPWRGSLLIASHGSWNREAMQSGRLIARADVQADGTVLSVQPVVGELNGTALMQGTWSVKPVDVKQGPEGAVYFSDDLGGRVFRIGYR